MELDLEFGDVGQFSEFTEEEREVIALYIGRIMIRLPFIAGRHVDHKDPIDTFRDYVQIDEDDDRLMRAALEFMHDVFDKKPRMRAAEIVAKWYPQGVMRLI